MLGCRGELAVGEKFPEKLGAYGSGGTVQRCAVHNGDVCGGGSIVRVGVMLGGFVQDGMLGVDRNKARERRGG